MIDRQNSSAAIKITPPDNSRHQILDVIQFSSSRQRMSVISRMPDDCIYLFEKTIKVEHRVSMRQSLEAQQALRRDRKQKSRSGFNRVRLTIDFFLRLSFQCKMLHPIRDVASTPRDRRRCSDRRQAKGLFAADISAGPCKSNGFESFEQVVFLRK